MSDLNTKMSHIGSHIPGFRKVHLGFKFVDYLIYAHLFSRLNNHTRRRERVFPANWRDYGSTRPYDTISTGVQLLAKYLHERNNKSRASPKRQIVRRRS